MLSLGGAIAWPQSDEPPDARPSRASSTNEHVDHVDHVGRAHGHATTTTGIHADAERHVAHDHQRELTDGHDHLVRRPLQRHRGVGADPRHHRVGAAPRDQGARYRTPGPAWLLSLHRYLGALALVFVGVHVAAILLDSYTDFGITDVLVPFTGSWHPLAVAWGIVGMYLLVAIEITSLLRHRMSKRRGTRCTCSATSCSRPRPSTCSPPAPT